MAKIRLNTQALAGSLTNNEVATNASIAYSKLNLATSIVDGDVAAGAAIVYSKLNLATSIVDGDVAATASIAYSKLNLATSIVDGDVSTAAAIVEAKLAFDTTAGHNHDGTNSRAISGSLEKWDETPTGAINGTNTLYTLATAVLGYELMVFLNGVKLRRVATAAAMDQFEMASNGSIFTVGGTANPPQTGDNLEVNYAY